MAVETGQIQLELAVRGGANTQHCIERLRASSDESTDPGKAKAHGDPRRWPASTATTRNLPTQQHGHKPTSILATRAMNAWADFMA